MNNYEYDYEYNNGYNNDQDYIDGEDKKPKLIVILGILMLIIITIIIVVSCVANKEPKSNNANLSYIRVSSGEFNPIFNNNVTSYQLRTDEDYVIFSCSSESAKAKVTGCNKKVVLYPEKKEHSITVTAENGAVKVYKFTITTTDKAKETEEISVKITSDVDSGAEVEKDVVLTAELSSTTGDFSYEWYKDDKKMNAVQNKITATESGKYYVKVIGDELNEEITSNVFVVNIKENNKEIDNKNNNTTSQNKNDYKLSITKVAGNSDKWVQSVTLSVETSTSNGLHSKPYSFDGGKTYQASNTKEFTKNQTVKIVVKDIKGNTVSKNIEITKIDSTIPKVSISESNKSNKSVTLKAVVTPTTTLSQYKYEWYKDGKIIKGASSNTYEVTQTGVYKVKVITGANKSAVSNEYKFEVINIGCPKFSASSTTGINVPARTWFNEVIYIKIVPSDETKKYDVYLNEYGVFDKLSTEFTYLDTFSGAVKVKIVNNGLRMLKVVAYDKSGNSEVCYSDVYFLK